MMITADSGEVPDRSGGASPGEIALSRWPIMKAFVLLGFTAIIGGGIVAALTGPTGFADGSWVAAYLVLVVGVGQLGLGVGQATLATAVPSPVRRRWQLILYNLGNAGVLLGTVADEVGVVMAGGAALVLALVLFLGAARRPAVHPRLLVAYRLLVTVLAVSVPTGLTLSVLRAG